MNHNFLTITAIAILAVGQATTQVQAQAQKQVSGASADVPELAALSGLVGDWDSKAEIRPTEGVTEGTTRKGTAKGEWIHGGRFLRQTWTLEADGKAPALSGSAIFGYDPAKKTYRSWNFSSDGSTSEGAGTFDEKTKTMTWTARDANGLRTVTRSAFPEPGIENWSITVMAADGKVIANLKGKNTRRKG